MKSSKPIISSNPEKKGRRDFLKQSWKILGLVAAVELAFFTTNLLKSSKNKKKGAESSSIKEVGNVEDFTINSVSTDRANKLFIVREPDGGFLALSLTCSHLGCSVAWDELKNQFICPCHASAFDKFGGIINSPAPRPLDFYPVIIEEGKVKIDFNKKTKRSKFETNQLTYAI